MREVFSSHAIRETFAIPPKATIPLQSIGIFDTSTRFWNGLDQRYNEFLYEQTGRFSELTLPRLLVKEKITAGMSEVYIGFDTRYGRMAAAKRVKHDHFDPEQQQREFIESSRLHGIQVRHPNIVTAYDLLEMEELTTGKIHTFILMEYRKGRDLETILKTRNLSFTEIRRITSDILRAGAHLESKGIIHRDHKPANVLYNEESPFETTVIDLGLAIHSTAVKKDGSISGTPCYLSPEEARGEPSTSKSDQYSLGLIIFELFTGRQFYSQTTEDQNKTLSELFLEIAQHATYSRRVSYCVQVMREKGYTNYQPLIDCLTTATNKEPQNRYPTIADFCVDKKQAFSLLNPPGHPASRLSHLPYTGSNADTVIIPPGREKQLE